MEISSSFGNALHRARVIKGMTQQQVAEKVDISVQWYQRVEKGKGNACFSTCARLAKMLGVDLNQFLEEDSIVE